MYYTVCEVAKRLNLSPHTIRFYAKEGLLTFVDRDQNGNRIFKESDFERLFIIASLKRAGMSNKLPRSKLRGISPNLALLGKILVAASCGELNPREIKQIREFTVLCDQGDPTIAQRLKIILDQREAVEEQITELQDALDVLKYKTWLYEVALEAGTTAVHDHMPLEDMPPNIRKIKERIRRLTDDMEQRYKGTAKE